MTRECRGSDLCRQLEQIGNLRFLGVVCLGIQLLSRPGRAAGQA